MYQVPRYSTPHKHAGSISLVKAHCEALLVLPSICVLYRLTPQILLLFSLAIHPPASPGDPFAQRCPGEDCPAPGRLLAKGAIFEAAGGPGGLFPGSAALAGTCRAPWRGSPSRSCSPARILSRSGERPGGVAGPGQLCFTPQSRTFPC